MTTFFVSRHRGAADWACAQGLAVDHRMAHLELDAIRPGDVVIGTLPVHLAALVCARGARYLHLVLELPPERRGQELSASDMAACGARLEEYRVQHVAG